MNTTDIINKLISIEKLAIRDQFIIVMCGVLLAIVSAISVSGVIKPEGKEEETLIANQETPIANILISATTSTLVGFIAVTNPIKEIFDRKDNIRTFQAIQYTCDFILKPEEEGKCWELIKPNL